MSTQITLGWEKDLTLETLLDGHKMIIDRDMENGGNDEGPRSKALMFVVLTGCSATDVIPLFGKMGIRFKKVSIDVKVESSDTIPTVYTAFHTTYHIQGNKEDAVKTDKAIRLPQEKHCGVGLMMGKITPITYEAPLNGEPLKPYPNDE